MMSHIDLGTLHHEEESVVLVLGQHLDGRFRHLGQTRLLRRTLPLSFELVLHVVPAEQSWRSEAGFLKVLLRVSGT